MMPPPTWQVQADAIEQHLKDIFKSAEAIGGCLRIVLGDIRDLEKRRARYAEKLDAVRDYLDVLKIVARTCDAEGAYEQAKGIRQAIGGVRQRL
jgi:hypothetical protein